MMKILNTFSDFQKASNAGEHLKKQRQLAFEKISNQNFPNKKDEDWKYINLKPILESKASALDATLASELTHEDLVWARGFVQQNAINLVFLNGQLNLTLSNMDELSSYLDVSAMRFEEAKFRDKFAELNQAFFSAGISLELARDKSVEKPLMVWNLISSKQEKMASPRLQLKLNFGSKLSLLEGFASKDSAHFQNSVLSVQMEESSSLTYVKLQNEGSDSFHISNSNFQLQKSAALTFLQVSIGAQTSRYNVQVDLLGQSAFAAVFGASLTMGTQHSDSCTLISHHVGSCETQQLFKSILADSSRSVFSGKIYIAKDAQLANSSQLNNSLLLSSLAEADSKPQLEIYADDVKASHGSTVGQLNDDEIFYLQSRGISKAIAVPMLSQAFLEEVILKIENKIMSEAVLTHARAAFAKLPVDIEIENKGSKRSESKI